jgi:group I intron endonuclease
MAVIYRITNMANDHYYIGSAESFERRRWQHTYALKRNEHKNPRLQAAWNKYGAEMFVFEILETVPEGRHTFDVENTYLMKCVGQPDCYNINVDAFVPRLGIPHTEAAKAKTSQNRKGKAAGANHYRYGTTLSEEVRVKIGDTQRGKPKGPGRRISDAGRAKIMAAAAAGRYSHWTGRTHTEEAKQKMRKQIDATDPQGTVHRYGSLTETLQSLELLMPTLNRALKSGKPLSKGPRMGWSFKYVDTLPTT